MAKKKEHIWMCKGENLLIGIKCGVVGDCHPPTIWAKVLEVEDQVAIANCKSEKATMDLIGRLTYKSFEKVK